MLKRNGIAEGLLLSRIRRSFLRALSREPERFSFRASASLRTIKSKINDWMFCSRGVRVIERIVSSIAKLQNIELIRALFEQYTSTRERSKKDHPRCIMTLPRHFLRAGSFIVGAFLLHARSQGASSSKRASNGATFCASRKHVRTYVNRTRETRARLFYRL